MPSTFSPNLALELIGTGEQSGTWGTTTNTNLGTLIDQAISGYVIQAVANGTTNITIPNGTTGVARNMYLELQGALTTTTNLTVPDTNKKLYFIYNNTSGGIAVTVKTIAGNGVAVPAGKKAILVSDGTNVVEAMNQVVGDFAVGGTLGVTGITTLGAAIVGPATATVFNTVSTTANAFGAATALNFGGNVTTWTPTTGTTFTHVTATATTLNLFNTVATTVNAFGAATTLNIGNASMVGGTARLYNGNFAGTLGVVGTTTLTGVTATSITDSGLTSTRMTYAGTAGLLKDSANMTFDGTTLTVSYLAIGNISSERIPYNAGTGSLTVSNNLQFTGDNTLVISGITIGKGAGNMSFNSAFGYRAIYATATGNYNTALGAYAATATTSGQGNSFAGYSSGSRNTTGSYNSVVGNQAYADPLVLGTFGTGSYNCALGNSTLISNTTGAGNIAIGTQSLGGNTTGNYSTSVGYNAGLTVVGSTNAFFGYNAGSTITTGNYNVIIGSYTGVSTPIANSGSNYIVLSDGQANVRAYWNGSAATFNGALNVSGALSKGSGSFRISHPLPSLNKTHDLIHSFIEGPQADLIYRGRVSLIAGKATINIDSSATMTEGTFELLCRDTQCFTSNETDWNHVRGCVVGNILTIECQDKASIATISWMVIGERQDKHMMETEWTDDNGKVVVEPLKLISTAED